MNKESFDSLRLDDLPEAILLSDAKKFIKNKIWLISLKLSDEEKGALKKLSDELGL